MAQWCNPLTLQPEQSGGVFWSRTFPHVCHDKELRTRLGLFYFCVCISGCLRLRLSEDVVRLSQIDR